MLCAFARVTPTWFWLRRTKNTWLITGQATSEPDLSQKEKRVKANFSSLHNENAKCKSQNRSFFFFLDFQFAL
jgi:hypothetical protein